MLSIGPRSKPSMGKPMTKPAPSIKASYLLITKKDKGTSTSSLQRTKILTAASSLEIQASKLKSWEVTIVENTSNGRSIKLTDNYRKKSTANLDKEMKTWNTNKMTGWKSTDELIIPSSEFKMIKTSVNDHVKISKSEGLTRTDISKGLKGQTRMESIHSTKYTCTIQHTESRRKPIEMVSSQSKLTAAKSKAFNVSKIRDEGGPESQVLRATKSRKTISLESSLYSHALRDRADDVKLIVEMEGDPSKVSSTCPAL